MCENFQIKFRTKGTKSTKKIKKKKEKYIKIMVFAKKHSNYWYFGMDVSHIGAYILEVGSVVVLSSNASKKSCETKKKA